MPPRTNIMSTAGFARKPPNPALQTDSRTIVGAFRALFFDAATAERKRYCGRAGDRFMALRSRCRASAPGRERTLTRLEFV